MAKHPTKHVCRRCNRRVVTAQDLKRTPQRLRAMRISELLALLPMCRDCTTVYIQAARPHQGVALDRSRA